MQFLTSKFTVAKWSAIALTPLLALIAGLIISIEKPSSISSVAAQTTSVDPVCIAEGLTIYMNTLIDARKENPTAFSNIKFLTPAFNITNETEAAIFDNMVVDVGEGRDGITANFNDVDGFAANAYSDVTGDPDQRGAYLWFANLIYPNSITGQSASWRDDRFIGHPTFFTEYGNFNFNEGDGRAANLIDAKTQFDLAAADNNIASVNYFNALGGNKFGAGGASPNFYDRHYLSPSELNSIIASEPAIAGVNSAMPVTASFPAEARGYSSNLRWTTQISYSRGDAPLVAEYVRQAYNNGFTPILRVCSMNTCDFANPDDYASFLRDINSQLFPGQILYVLAGPNEPATELWATPECIIERPLNIYDVACEAINPNNEPDYHSLRPFPANACNKSRSGTTQCGNDFVLNETIEVTPSQAIPESCQSIDGGGQRCSFRVQSYANAQIDLGLAELPVMGNTEKVPNSVTSVNQIEFGQRMTDYVSWYLNGVVQRAEERYFTFPSDANDLIGYSGPLRKILPFAIQNYAQDPGIGLPQQNIGLRRIEADRAGRQSDDTNYPRHNQTVECGSVDSPEPCYSTGGGQNRLKQVAESVASFVNGRLNINLNPAFSYIPFSSTEDRIGTAALNPVASDFVQGDVTISGLTFSPANEAPKDLYFAHMQESMELATITQKTFVPGQYSSNLNDPKTDDVTPPQIEAGCVINETRTNPGDNLYGNFERIGQPVENNNGLMEGAISYTAQFNCDFTPTVDQGQYNACMAAGSCSGPEQCDGTWSPPPGSCGIFLGRCTPPPPTPGDFSNAGCREQATVISSTCQKQVTVPLQMLTKTPEAESVWNQLVAGPWSVFRRFFPQVGPGTPVDKIQDIPAETVASYGAESTGATGGTLVSTGVTAGGNRSADAASLYLPHIGGIQEYFLNGLQKALLPFGGELPADNDDGGSDVPTGGDCSYKDVNIETAMRNAASKYGVPVEMLEAIYQTEGFDYRANPGAYTCSPNFAGALGIMQITQGTYNIVTCENERIASDKGVCAENSPLLSRCEPNDEMELAARVLLLKSGHWGYGPGRCLDLGDLDARNITEVYRAGCNYYGSCNPDTLTINAARALIPPERWRNGNVEDMGYGDYVCAMMSMINPSLNYCNSPSNYPPRP